MENRGEKGRQPRIIKLGPESFSSWRSEARAKIVTKKASTIVREIFIRAPIERCFEIIDRQLKETPDWDPTIRWVEPVSTRYLRVGSMSRITLDLGGSIEEVAAVVRSFSPNRSILWTSTHSTQLQEEWQLRPGKPQGTLVTIIFSYNPKGWVLGRLSDKLVTRGKVEKVISEMLERLRVVAESS